MKTPETIPETIEALRWFVSYYPKWSNIDPSDTMEHAANLIEELSKELEAMKHDLVELAEATGSCLYCKHWTPSIIAECPHYKESYCYEWRGVCDANSK